MLSFHDVADGVAFALAVGALFNSWYGPKIAAAVQRAELKALRSRVKKLDGIEHEGD